MNIFNWFKKNRESNTKLRELEQILKWITKAKEAYIKENLRGMCRSFSQTSRKIELVNKKKGDYVFNEDIHKYIPEFNPDYLNAAWKNPYGYWWPPKDRQSRIKAFDELITLYKARIVYAELLKR